MLAYFKARQMTIGGLGADTFVLRTDAGSEDILGADVITDFNAVQGDRIGIIGEISDLFLETFDTNGDGILDTVVRMEFGSQTIVLGSILGSVETGPSILTLDNFTTISESTLESI